MNYTYKKIKILATRLSRELGLQMRVHKEGKSLVYFLSEWQDLHPYAWVDINIGTYDKWMQDLHMSREIHGENDIYVISDFEEQTQAMVRDARRKGEVVVWVEMAIRTMRHKRHNARCALIKGNRWKCGDEDFDYIKQWLEEQRANVAPEDTVALKVINSRGFKDPNYDETSETISVQKEGKWGLLDKQGNVLCEPMYNDISNFQNGTAVAHLDNKAMLINTNGEVVKIYDYNQVERLPNGYAKVQQNNKWGFINPDGEEIVSPQFDAIHIYSKEDIGEIRVGRKWGFITTEGKVICPAKYEKTLSFSEGIAAVKFNHKWGLINEQGKDVVEPKYDEITKDCDGIIYVRKDGKWGYLDKEFDEACELKYEYDWFKGLTLGDKCYKPNADGVLEEYVEELVDDDDLPF